MPRPRFILNNIPAFRQVCTAVDFSYSALRHALGPRDVRNLYRARATKDRKTSLVASCTWKCESLGQASLSGARRDTAIRISSVTMVLETHFSGILSLILFTRPMPRPRPRFILNNIPAFRQVCTAVDFSYSALRHALGPRDVRNLYRARATKDRKTSLVASCTWKQTVVFTYSIGLKKSFYYQVVTVHTQKSSSRASFYG